MADRNLYTIGWICAIHTELVAALALLDERHDRPTEVDPNDSNSYELGKISGHYVAIACLPAGEQGIAAAAGSATNLLRSFPNIRFGLMVGTGGGAPTSYHDIRLGDVVVSTPGDGKGGVFQYDFGKTMQNQTFVETGFLDQPPSFLRAAVTGLKAKYEMDGHSLTEEVNKALQRKPRLQKTYCRPQTGDILYRSAYTHISGPWKDCEACDDDPSNCIPRRPRDENDDDPVIHYGLIASANQCMENALLRDKFAMEKGVLCFEMEAAGLMNHFPCLIIRGICDYADTHRNDKWKGYASMIAAAYARDLISRLIPGQVQKSETANEILLRQMSDLSHNTDRIAFKLDLAKLKIADGAEYDSYANQHEDECLAGTRFKILHDIEEWATSLSSKCIFWLNGMAGTGKSAISRTIAKRLQAKQLLGASFFFKTGEANRGNATRFFSTIASQLQTRIPGMADHLRKVIDSEPQISTKSLKQQFERLVLEPISCLKPANRQPSFLVVVIDALDECDDNQDVQVILNLFPQLHACTSMHFRVFITSRPELPIRLGFKDMEENKYQDLILHQIPEIDIEHDIRFFLKHRFDEIRKSRVLPQEWPGEININTLTAISIPLFIFAATMCRVFEDHDLDPGKCLDEYLKSEAADSKLDTIYLPVLNRICMTYSDNDRRKHQFIRDVSEVVSAIILLEEPLPIASLSKLIDIPNEAINSRLNSLHSVLNVPQDETLPIRLFHLSFRDFLLDQGTREKIAIWTDEEATNEKLYIRCLSIMRKSLKRNICNLTNYAIDLEEIPDEAISRCIPIHLEYSCRYWVRHLISYVSCRDRTVQLQDTQSFLEEHLLHWVEVMLILDQYEDALYDLKDLQLFKRNFANCKTAELIDEAIRFMNRGHRVMLTQPLHVYVSALMFVPTSSAIKRLFSAELPDFISMPRTVDSSWGAEMLCAMSIDCEVDNSGGAEPAAVEGSNTPTCFAISPNGMFFAVGIHSLMIIYENNATIIPDEGRWHRILDGVQALAFSPDSKSLVSCSRGSGKLQFWDTTTVTLQSTFDEDVSDVSSLVFTDSDQLLASPSGSWDFIRWNRATGIQRHTLEKRLPENARVTLSSNSLLLASHNGDKSINVWNLVTRNLKYALTGHDSHVTCITFSTDGRLLASGDEQGIIIIWDIVAGVQKNHMTQYFGSVLSITFSTENQLLAASYENFQRSTGYRDDDVLLWDLNQSNLIQILRETMGSTEFVQFLPDNKTLAAVGSLGQGSISLWDVTNISRNQQRHPSFVINTAFSLDGRLLASECAAGRIIIWNVESESIIDNIVGGHRGFILAFSPNNNLLVFTSSPEVIELWDINQRQQSSVGPFVENQPFYCVAFSPDSQLIAFLVDRKDIKIWDIATKTLKRTISNSSFDQPMNSICFSPNGQYLASSALYTLEIQRLRLIRVFRLPSRDERTENFSFFIDDTKIHFSRGPSEPCDFPLFDLWTPQGDFDRNMLSKWNCEWTNDMQAQWAVKGRLFII
ncbi:hypothetical protein Trisim1_005912 [Trichoderma cf. simile WF8]